jgi:hypothetical protein
MTESEWLACTEPERMLAFLIGRRASDRKRRLLACACVRRVWYLLKDERSRCAVEVAEQHADGRASEWELDDARRAAAAVPGFTDPAAPPHLPDGYAASAAWGSTDPSDLPFTFWAASFGAGQAAFLAKPPPAIVQALERLWVRVLIPSAPRGLAGRGFVAVGGAARASEKEGQCAALRDVFGNPFRPVGLDPAWLSADVRVLAQGAYDERTLPARTLDPARLAVLADALEEAGCDNADLLGHLRGEGPHVRGCWALDLVLGRE